MEKAFTSLQGLQFSALRLSKRSADPAIRGRKWRRAVDASWGEAYFTDIAPENCPKERDNSVTYLQMDVPCCSLLFTFPCSPPISCVILVFVQHFLKTQAQPLFPP